jgi:hypothetical protein
MDPDCKTYFIDYENIPQCPKEDAGKLEKYRKTIHDFIFEAIGLIVNGGQSMWVTKNLLEGEIDYKLIKCNSKTEDNFERISWVIDWKANKKGELEPVQTNLLSEMCKISKQISYTRLDFVPYIRSRVWENPERVFNLFTGLASDHEYVPQDVVEYEHQLKDKSIISRQEWTGL